MTALGAYYNDNEPFVAQWLRNLIAAGHLPAGTVDESDIRELKGSDLEGYDQVHLFAGIGGWPLALRLAGWPPERPVWTGSCPCQPFSAAGKGKGEADERHLWPAFLRLIAECRPPVCFGEQVASRLGREWLARVRLDLEGLGYAVGAADLCAAGEGAPHIRQRLWWVADSDCTDGRASLATGHDCRGQDAGREEADGQLAACGKACGVGDGERNDLGRDGGGPSGAEAQGRGGGKATGRLRDLPGPAGADGPWDGAAWLPCSDGKARRVEPSILPLAHELPRDLGWDGPGQNPYREEGPSRVGMIRGYGNAIVPAVAAVFIRAFLDTGNAMCYHSG